MAGQGIVLQGTAGLGAAWCGVARHRSWRISKTAIKYKMKAKEKTQTEQETYTNICEGYKCIRWFKTKNPKQKLCWQCLMIRRNLYKDGKGRTTGRSY